jgi:hypothetical protein
MAESDARRERLRRARSRLEEWTFAARDRAYAELFEGRERALDDDELRLLDRVDSDLTRQGDAGLWGADGYAVVAGDGVETAAPRVVCTYHPQIPSEGFRGAESLDEATRAELNDVLWDYCERVATNAQAELEAFLRTAREE